MPIVFSHGSGNSASSFSTIVKDLASQGHIVYCIEHNDRTALHTFDADNDGKRKYFKNVDMRDVNTMVAKLGIRLKELDVLISELSFLANKSTLNSEDEVLLNLD